MEQPTKRLFIGLRLPVGLSVPLAKFQHHSVDVSSDVRWTEYNDLHITLKYLGTLPCTDDSLKIALSAAKLSPASVVVAGADLFADAGVVFADIFKSASLLSLQEALEEVASRLGVRPSSRPYHPHITIARIGPRAAATTLPHLIAAKLQSFCTALPQKDFEATEVTVFQSLAGHYKPLYFYRLSS